MATQVRVKDRKTGLERVVGLKAYQLIPHRYIALAYLDEAGQQVDAPTVASKDVISKKKAVEPVGDDFGLPKSIPQDPVKRGRPKMTEAEKAAKKQQLEGLNAEAIKKVQEAGKANQTNK